MHCRWDATASVNPISAWECTVGSLAIDDEERGWQSLASNRQVNANCPWAGETAPSKSLSIISVWIKSSSSSPSFRYIVYGIMFTAAPPLTSILVIGLPLMYLHEQWPEMLALLVTWLLKCCSHRIQGQLSHGLFYFFIR